MIRVSAGMKMQCAQDSGEPSTVGGRDGDVEVLPGSDVDGWDEE